MAKKRANRKPIVDDEAARRSRAVVTALRAAVRAGDRERAAGLAERVRSDLDRNLRAFVWIGHPNRGEDIIHQAYVRLFAGVLKIGDTTGDALERNYLQTIRDRALDAVKAAKRHGGRELPYLTDEHGEMLLPEHPLTPWHEDSISEVVTLMTIEAVLSKVADERRRLAFRLHMEGNTAPEIAEALGIDPKTAVAWIARIQDLLRRELR